MLAKITVNQVSYRIRTDVSSIYTGREACLNRIVTVSRLPHGGRSPVSV